MKRINTIVNKHYLKNDLYGEEPSEDMVRVAKDLQRHHHGIHFYPSVEQKHHVLKDESMSEKARI